MSSAAPAPAAIPEDFPRIKTPASLAGVQMKLTARLIDGKYYSDFTDEELAARYAACVDLVTQLHPYCLRKKAEHPRLTLDQTLEKVGQALEAKHWDLTVLEIEWITEQLRPLLQCEPAFGAPADSGPT